MFCFVFFYQIKLQESNDMSYVMDAVCPYFNQKRVFGRKIFLLSCGQTPTTSVEKPMKLLFLSGWLEMIIMLGQSIVINAWKNTKNQQFISKL